MIDQAMKIARIMLGDNRPITRDEIERIVSEIILMGSFAGIDKDQLIREIEYKYNIVNQDPRFLENLDTKRPWLVLKIAGFAVGPGYIL